MSEEYDQSKGGAQWGEEESPSLRHDDFVGRIVRDPKEPPSVMILSGYLGSSSEEGHVRLYLDEELCRYVELPEKAIRHAQELPPEQSPLGGSLVWIDRDAEVLHGAAGSERRKATFLEGQIAQDYIGAAATGAGAANFPSLAAAACGPSQVGPCIPRTELLGCRTLTGILCTRIGPGCGRTSFDPGCTISGPNCRTQVKQQCQSIYNPCITQGLDCQASGFVPCNPPIDVTIWQEQFSPQAAARVGVGGVGGVGGIDPTVTVFQTGFNCPSVFDNCATVTDSFCPTRFPGCGFTRIACPPSVVVRCPTVNFNCPSVAIRCPTRGEPRCVASRSFLCPDTIAGCQFESVACGFDPGGGGEVFQQRQADFAAAPGVGGAAALPPTRFCPSVFVRCQTANFNCPSVLIRCQPTRSPQPCPTMPTVCCLTQFGQCETFGACPSAVDACPSRFGCESQAGCFESQACGGGFDPGINQAGGFGAQAFRAEAFAAQPQAAAAAPLPPTRACPSQLISCITQVNCLTRTGCQSRYIPCQSQLVRCPSAIDACPTRFNCPSLPNGCPGYTQLGACPTVGPCPSAVDACPTRLGCFETAAGCFESVACTPGGFDPGGFGGGGGFGGVF